MPFNILIQMELKIQKINSFFSIIWLWLEVHNNTLDPKYK